MGIIQMERIINQVIRNKFKSFLFDQGIDYENSKAGVCLYFQFITIVNYRRAVSNHSIVGRFKMF